MLSYQCKYPLVKDKMASRPSYLQHGNPISGKDGLDIETGPWFLTVSPMGIFNWIHWSQDKMAAILQTKFLNAFSWMKMYEFPLTFHWRFSRRVKLTIFNIDSDNGLAPGDMSLLSQQECSKVINFHPCLLTSQGLTLSIWFTCPSGMWLVLKIYVPWKRFHEPSQYLYKPCKAYVYCWKNKYMPTLKNHMPCRACNHKS